MDDKKTTAVAVEAVVRYAVIERIRCLRLATGQVVYEFWADTHDKIVRIDADAYEAALNHARDHLQEEAEA